MSSSSPAAVAIRSSSRCPSIAAPAGPAGSAESGRCRATFFHACCFLSCEVRHSQQHNIRGCDGAEHSWGSQQVQPEPAAAAVLPAKPPTKQARSSCQGGMIETAAHITLHTTSCACLSKGYSAMFCKYVSFILLTDKIYNMLYRHYAINKITRYLRHNPV